MPIYIFLLQPFLTPMLSPRHVSHRQPGNLSASPSVIEARGCLGASTLREEVLQVSSEYILLLQPFLTPMQSPRHVSHRQPGNLSASPSIIGARGCLGASILREGCIKAAAAARPLSERARLRPSPATAVTCQPPLLDAAAGK